jgi:hypothetical protein
MNDLVDLVNSKIKDVCAKSSQCIFVDSNSRIDTMGGHFCEPGVDEHCYLFQSCLAKDREETWFYEWYG